VVKFAAGGKQRGKKDLAMLAMETYGQDVFVASVCLEANYAQVMKAFAEAEAHKGVSLVVAYAPCVMQVRERVSSGGSGPRCSPCVLPA
jgi:pyruvate-ferredoxin/flavodoxin oxidoreductase